MNSHYVGVISGKELALSVNGKLAVIFDENIRLFEPDSRVNSGILTTATSNTEADMFYFYNNGVTFIGDSVKYSPTNQMVSIEGASIVNGCQTVTTLCKAYEQGRLNDDVFILVRFIMSGDYDKRSRITEALNSQTPIKDSYFIANHPIVRELQKELLKKHYYLERQVNEFAYKKSYGNEIPDKTFEILHLDDSVQYFTGYYMDKYAPAAKSGKGSLFNKDIIEDILSQISADKVITARETYVHVAAIITKFRRNRRNEKNTEFAKVMRFDNDQFDSNDYLFLNTADIILLNAVGHLKNHVLNAANCTETFDDESLVRVAILHLKKMIHSNPQYKRMLPANITRNKQVYVELRDDLSKTISKDLS